LFIISNLTVYFEQSHTRLHVGHVCPFGFFDQVSRQCL